ncbi:MAG TPA: RHS repeat-associated core domain-containing protein, partial [Chthonomonadaceae bacterium]|nr:RHS repeat-associated core domain-containing protein [Chthonomonadaceae bacterium]
TGPGNSSIALNYLYIGGPLLGAIIYDESDQQVRQVALKYGKEGELLSRSGSIDPFTYTYDAFYRLQTLADGAGNKTTYSYSPAGYLASIKYPKGDTVKFTAYDPMGNVLIRVDGRGIKTYYVYNDPENLLTNIQYPADTGHNVAFTYDAYGRRSGITDGTGSQTINYDDDGLVTNVKTTYNSLSAQSIAYSYYPDGSRQGMSTPAGNFTYGYTGNGLLQSLTNPFNETTNCSYTDNHLLKTVTLPNGVISSYGYDPRNQPTSLTNKTASGTVLSSFTGMAYDAASNRTTMTASMPAVPADGGLTTYAYDSKNELTQEQSARAGGYTDNCVFDLAENPTTFRGATNTFNTDNQITNSGYAYDGNGNPSTYQGATLAFDEENRLTGVGASFTADYTGDGLRAWKQGSGGRSYFLYDGTFPVCELDASGNVQAVNTSSTNGLVSRRTTSTNVFYTFDPQGNVAQKLDASGNVLSSHVYDGFGAAKAGGPTGDPFGFGAQFGYYTDVETGLQLLTHRYYDAGTGRFLTRDPIRYSGGINVYAYVQNRALIAHDPSGTSFEDTGCDIHKLAVTLEVWCTGMGVFLAIFAQPTAAGFAICVGISYIVDLLTADACKSPVPPSCNFNR